MCLFGYRCVCVLGGWCENMCVYLVIGVCVCVFWGDGVRICVFIWVCVCVCVCVCVGWCEITSLLLKWFCFRTQISHQTSSDDSTQ